MDANYAEAKESPKGSDNKIKIGAVSYLNTKPLIYGFQKGLLSDESTLVMDYPGNIAASLLNGTIDIGLVPVAILAQMKSYHIVADYGIACDGAVASVCLFSEVPLQEITTVILDYQSRTSVLLVQYLFKEFWKLSPAFVAAGPDFINQLGGTTAAVIIGDRAFEQRLIAKYVYDLGDAWKQHTGLPFLFAAWVSCNPVSTAFKLRFNQANKYGLDRIREVIAQNPFNNYDLFTYYTQNIQYEIDESKMEGLKVFLDWCKLHAPDRDK